MGLFNSHNPIWGGNKLDEKGKAVEDFIAGRANMLETLSLQHKQSYSHSQNKGMIKKIKGKRDSCKIQHKKENG